MDNKKYFGPMKLLRSKIIQEIKITTLSQRLMTSFYKFL